MTRHRIGVVAALLALLTAGPAAADSVVLDSVVLYRGAAQGCTAQVTADAQWQTIALRLEKPAGAGLSCRLERADTLDALARSLSALEAEGGPIVYRSIFLGRIVDYEWLSRHLADAAARSADWSTATGKPNNGATLNSFAAGLLAEPEILAATSAAAKPAGYRVTGVSCEKVLVSDPGLQAVQPDWVAAGKRLPFDALCWLILTADRR
ncbi:MAG: hypothetical protein ACREDZ_02745 [Kiloniellales bacterium]